MMVMKSFTLLCILFMFKVSTGQVTHTVVAPKAFRIGTAEKVVVNLHGYGSATVHAYLLDLPSRENVFGQINPLVLNSAQTRNPIDLFFTVRSQDIAVFQSRQKVLLTVQVRNSAADFQTEIEVLLSGDVGYLFVTTNRPTYRPGELVSIQVAPLTQDFEPSQQIVDVTVKTPDNIGIFRKAVRLPADNFIELQYPISDNPELGKWFVEATYSAHGYKTSAETQFVIERYVLPTFNVKIDLPQLFVLTTDIGISGEIQSSYSYGEPVDGSYFVSMKLKKSPEHPYVEFFKRPGRFFDTARITNGRASFDVPIQDIDEVLSEGETLELIAQQGGSIRIEATVNGDADGILESSISPEIPIITTPFEIDFRRTSLFYTPGLAYQLYIDIRDTIGKQPLPGVPLEIRVVEGENSQTFNIPSDQNGQVDFQIDFRGSGQQDILLSTTSPGVEDASQSSLTLTLQAYSSDSNSFLQIKSVSSIASVGQGNFFLTFSHNQATVDEIRYYVLARGSIVFSGVNIPNRGSTESTQLVEISQRLVPSARVVAYYVVNNEIVSNSFWFDVVDQCNEELSVSVPVEVLPGTNVNFRITGASNALVSVSGVDRAAYFLYGDGRIKRQSIFDKMDDYDQGCVRSGGSNTRSVFLSAGLILASSNISPSEVNTLDCTASLTGLRKKRQASTRVSRAELEAQLEICARDGQLPSNSEENCITRGLRVRDNKEFLYPGCWNAFRKSCFQALVQRRELELRGSGRSVGDRAQADANLARQRSDFQESLVFTTIRLDDAGQASFNRRARDSITTFDIDAIGMQDAREGFCIAEPTEVRVFKSLFIQFYVPYALKLREQASLRIAVFNYDSVRDYRVEVEINPSTSFCTHFLADDFSTFGFLNVRRNAAASRSFVVFPLSIPKGGKAPIEFRIKFDGRIVDSIKKEILIEPEGEIKETFESFALDVGDRNGGTTESNFAVAFNFPEQFVPGTRECTLFAYTNFLGPTIEVDPDTGAPNGVESFFRKPRGCGEQTVIYVAPNIYAHSYLQASGGLVEGSPAHTKSIENMAEGYGRNLYYRSDPVGKIAFAVWKHEIPSTWLNAFIDKIYSKAKQYYTDLDVGPICSSLEWLLTQQNAAGFFEERRPPYHREMKGAVGGRYTLTTYVVISLIESAGVCPDLLVQLDASLAAAIAFLDGSKDHVTFTNRPYSVALLSYALVLHDPRSALTSEIFGRLRSLATVSDDNRQIHWKGRPLGEIEGSDIHDYWYRRKPQAIDVEATSYALLAHIEWAHTHGVTQDILDVTRKIVTWLICQRNEGGAFISTQDTVIGLQALATYEIWIDSVEPRQVPHDITLSFYGVENSEWGVDGSEEVVHLDNRNIGLKTTIEVPPNVMSGGGVAVHANGTGEGILSYRCIYRSVVDEGSCHFSINTQVAIINEREYVEEGALMRIKVTITISKPVGAAAEASIVDIGLLSGFAPHESSLGPLSQAQVVDGIVERYDVTNQNLVLYLRRISDTNIVISFEMRQQVRVVRPQPAKINVYDYYEPSVSCGDFYALPDDLPDLRTSNCDGENADPALCRCAEGGCMKCRTRDQQLSNTQCLGRRGAACLICDGESCDNLYDIACRSNTNYVYIVRVTEVVEGGNIFTYFRGEIDRILKYGDDIFVERSSNHTFTSRTDCFDSCKDPALLNKDGTFRPYVKVGSELLVMGGAPEAALDRNGNSVSHYRLDVHAFVERHIPATVCDRSRTSYEGNRLRCGDPNHDRTDNQAARCVRLGKLISACNTFDEFVTQLAEGCD